MTTAPDKEAKTPEAPEKEVRAEQALSGTATTAVDDASAIDAALADTMEPSGETLQAPEPLQAELEQALLREQLAGVTIDCFFAPHVVAEDIHKLGEMIGRADIVVFEVVNWNDASKETLDRISAFDTEDPQVRKFINETIDTLQEKGESFDAERFRLLAGTGKLVLLPDIPENHPVTVAFEQFRSEADKAHTQAWGQFFAGNYDEMITLETQAATLDYKGQRLRENFIIKAIAFQIKEVRDVNPDLADKDDIHVLMQYGSSHKTLFHDLKKAGVSTTATMGYPLDILPHTEEIKRRMYFGKEVPEELYARSLFSSMFLTTIENANLNMSNEQSYLIIRKSLDRLTVEDMRELSSQLGKIESQEEKWNVMNAFFSEKGAIIPDTDEEIRAILGSEYKQYTRLATAA